VHSHDKANNDLVDEIACSAQWNQDTNPRHRRCVGRRSGARHFLMRSMS